MNSLNPDRSFLIGPELCTSMRRALAVQKYVFHGHDGQSMIPFFNGSGVSSQGYMVCIRKDKCA